MAGLKDIVESDLRRGMRLMVRVQDEIDPQIRFATPYGDYALAVTLPAADDERKAFYGQVKMLMAVKQALSFTMVCGLTEPDMLMAVGVSREEVVCCGVSVPAGRPLTLEGFKGVEWFGKDAVGDEVIGLLPRGVASMSECGRHELERLFGRDGLFPLVHLPSKRIVGLGA